MIMCNILQRIKMDCIMRILLVVNSSSSWVAANNDIHSSRCRCREDNININMVRVLGEEEECR